MMPAACIRDFAVVAKTSRPPELRPNCRLRWLCLKVVNFDQTRLSQWTKLAYGPDSKFRSSENSTTAAVPDVLRAHVDDWRFVIQDGP